MKKVNPLTTEQIQWKRVPSLAPPVASAFDEWWAVLKINSKTTYYISTYGRLYSTLSQRIIQGVKMGKNRCFDWTVQEHLPFAMPRAKEHMKKVQRDRTTIARLVAYTFIKQPSPKHNVVMHEDHDSNNDKATNLRWTTKVEQMEFSRRSMKWRNGGAGRRQMTDAEVKEIRILCVRKKKPIREVAKKYQVTENTIFRILTGEMHAKAGGPIRAKQVPKKMPAETVKAVREELAAGVKGTAIAAYYNINPTAVSRIKNNKYHKGI